MQILSRRMSPLSVCRAGYHPAYLVSLRGHQYGFLLVTLSSYGTWVLPKTLSVGFCVVVAHTSETVAFGEPLISFLCPVHDRTVSLLSATCTGASGLASQRFLRWNQTTEGSVGHNMGLVFAYCLKHAECILLGAGPYKTSFILCLDIYVRQAERFACEKLTGMLPQLPTRRGSDDWLGVL